MKIKFRGFWLIVDGGYLRWPTLICPVPNDHNPSVRLFGKHLESVRKDSECTFGSLKKRFCSLKAWTELRLLEDIKNQFVMCCIIHNILLEHDGFLDADYSPEAHVAPIGVRGDRMWVGWTSARRSGFWSS